MCCKEIGYFSHKYVTRYIFSLCVIRFAHHIVFKCNSIKGTTKLIPVLIKFSNEDYKHNYRQKVQWNKSIERAISMYFVIPKLVMLVLY